MRKQQDQHALFGKVKRKEFEMLPSQLARIMAQFLASQT